LHVHEGRTLGEEVLDRCVMNKVDLRLLSQRKPILHLVSGPGGQWRQQRQYKDKRPNAESLHSSPFVLSPP
jgi:hypothetical protein